MIIVLQRVKNANCTVRGRKIAEIGRGILIFLGIERGDTERDAERLARKCGSLRIFQDSDHKMNLSVKEINGECLVISQFTLTANTKKGKRPNFINAAPPAQAISLYNSFIKYLREENVGVEQGIFGEYMQIELINDGPVTLILKSGDRC
jgi:D-tyrosyl-tRNA(Tyr) deacylase